MSSISSYSHDMSNICSLKSEYRQLWCFSAPMRPFTGCERAVPQIVVHVSATMSSRACRGISCEQTTVVRFIFTTYSLSTRYVVLQYCKRLSHSQTDRGKTPESGDENGRRERATRTGDESGKRVESIPSSTVLVARSRYPMQLWRT